MQRAIGISVHTGWGACVVVGGSLSQPEIVGNEVIKLLDDAERFCFHRAAEMKPAAAEEWLARVRAKALDPASYPHTSGDYNLMMSGGENGSQEDGSTGPSVHERIQDGGCATGAECWLLRGQPKARNARIELI
jgi:hypothetical protein